MLAGLILCLGLVFYFVSIATQSDPAALTANDTADTEKVGVPVRLKIPQIRVDAAVEPVGLTPEGAMDVPKGLANTGWYSLGPRPGQKGSAVIDGHFDQQGGAPGVFFDLHKLQKGDKVSVEDGQGMTVTFVVRESRKYDPNADATAVFTSNDGRVHLNLITCAGTWNTAEQTYSNRLVVFTDKE